MKPLFISLVCDYCDGLESEHIADRGWIVLSSKPLPMQEFVWGSPADAERWRAQKRLDDCPIAEVRSLLPFRWRSTAGACPGLKVVDGLVTIYADRRFSAGKNRAYLAT